MVDTTIVRETLAHDVPSIMSRIRLRADLDQSAAIDDGHATAGVPAHVDERLNGTGPVGSVRAGESDRG